MVEVEDIQTTDTWDVWCGDSELGLAIIQERENWWGFWYEVGDFEQHWHEFGEQQPTRDDLEALCFQWYWSRFYSRP